MKILQKCAKLCQKNGWQIANIDSTLILQTPKILPYIQKIKINIAQALKIKVEQIGIKATTNEKLGALGRSEGAAAFANTLIYKKSEK